MPTNIFRKSSNSYKRVVSGALIGLVFLTAIFFSRTLFLVLMMGISAVMLMEWYSMTHAKSKYLYAGLVIIPVPIVSLLYISSIDFTGWLLFTFFSIIWAVDVVAMYVGKAIKGPKLAPILSPGKTISGFCGGVLAASLLPVIFSFIPFYHVIIFSKFSMFGLMFKFALIAILAQMSDLFISYFKRKFKVKDSGDIIPGHGGMLDRFDSIVFTAPILAFYLHIQL